MKTEPWPRAGERSRGLRLSFLGNEVFWDRGRCLLSSADVPDTRAAQGIMEGGLHSSLKEKPA